MQYSVKSIYVAVCQRCMYNMLFFVPQTQALHETARDSAMPVSIPAFANCCWTLLFSASYMHSDEPRMLECEIQCFPRG